MRAARHHAGLLIASMCAGTGAEQREAFGLGKVPQDAAPPLANGEPSYSMQAPVASPEISQFHITQPVVEK